MNAMLEKNGVSIFMLKNEEIENISTYFIINNIELVRQEEDEIVDCARSCSGSCSGDCSAYCNGNCFTSCEGSCSMFQGNDW